MVKACGSFSRGTVEINGQRTKRATAGGGGFSEAVERTGPAQVDRCFLVDCGHNQWPHMARG